MKERPLSAASSEIPFDRHANGRETVRVFVIAAGVAALAGIVFSTFPGLDIAVSGHFRREDGAFAFAVSPFFVGLRELFLRSFTLWYIALTVCGIVAFRRQRPVFNLDWKRWLYLGSCSLAGPLLIVNILLKEQWGRWRPREIFELGGREIFTPVLDTGGTCVNNCSFVSGEVASMAMVFFALAFATRHWRPIHYGLGVLMGGLEAFIRIGQGGHFLSDTIFAIVMMAMIAALMHAWFFISPYSPLEPARQGWKRLVDHAEEPLARIGARALDWLDKVAPRR
jgi:lipid A 4'-phosphatase